MHTAGRFLFILLVLMAVLPAGAAVGQDGPIDVIEVSGALDELEIDFVLRTIDSVAADSELIILQLDSPAVLSDEFDELVAVVADPPVPLVVWVGPRPAQARGRTVELLAFASVGMAAPGTEIDAAFVEPNGPPPTLPTRVEEPIPGIVDEVVPVLGGVVQSLNERSFVVRGEQRVVTTTEEFIDDNGETRVRPVSTRFHEPGLITRLLHLATSAETTFALLTIGLAVAVFEFYAAGVGVAAAVAVGLLFLAGYGLAVLPVEWWAVGLVVLGILLYTYDFQRTQLRIAAVAGTVALVAGGRYLVGDPSQLRASWWAVLLIVVAVGLFYLFGITTVVRARFSTPTIGREHLVGKEGRAVTEVSPEGYVEVDGAKWRASAQRAAGIAAGDPVIVSAVSGVVLEVEPVKGVASSR